jgi:ribosomal protein L40E
VDFTLSGLTKKVVYADRLLSAILGVSEGEMVSYAQISKGVHKYIKDNDLKNVSARPQPVTEQVVKEEKPSTLPAVKRCRDCGAEIPQEAVFCDLCGVSQ